MSDYDRVKAWRKAKRKPCPGGCGLEVAHDTILCRACTSLSRRGTALARTIADVKRENKSKRWSDHVRYFARELYKFDKCDICGYSNHVEIAHLRAVASFPDSATIREVNSRDNVMGLCPNHHWEFDNGILILPV